MRLFYLVIKRAMLARKLRGIERQRARTSAKRKLPNSKVLSRKRGSE